MKERGVFIAHCPDSNTNLSSGVAPVRRYLEEGMNIGLGSDVAGGTSENLFAAMAQSIQASKLRWRLLDASLKPLTIEEAFYMANQGRVGASLERWEALSLAMNLMQWSAMTAVWNIPSRLL